MYRIKTNINDFIKLYESNQVNRKYVNEFLSDFGFFITLNLSQVTKMGIDETSNDELNQMMLNLRKPIINGKSYVELIKDINTIYNNPRLVSEIVNKVREFLTYIEPRIIKFVSPSESKDNWLDKITNFKERYKIIIRND